jgi:nitrile hydratase subunit beta
MGGQSGFGPVPVDDEDAEPFRADWETRVYALTRALLRNRVFDLDEFRDALERIPPEDYLASSYYERWLKAIERVLTEKGAL